MDLEKTAWIVTILSYFFNTPPFINVVEQGKCNYHLFRTREHPYLYFYTS